MKSIFAFTLLLVLTNPAVAADAAAGKAKSMTCVACHGAAGISSSPIWPNLAGQKEAYLAKSIKAYRDGERKDPMMMPMVKNLSDSDIADLAAYFSSLPGCP